MPLVKPIYIFGLLLGIHELNYGRKKTQLCMYEEFLDSLGFVIKSTADKRSLSTALNGLCLL